MTVPTTSASLTSPSKPALEETEGNEHMEHTDQVEVNTRLTLDLATAGKENRRPHKLKKKNKKKKKLTAREEEPDSLKDAQPVDETPHLGLDQLHLDNRRMRNDLNNLTTELGAIRNELVALKREYMKQRSLLGIYRQLVQGPMDLKAALKKQNDELCDRMDELAETNHKLWKLRQQVGAGRPLSPPVARPIERGALAQPIHRKPPETKEELEEALAKASHTNSQLSGQNLKLAMLVTALKMELTKYRYLDESDYDDHDSDGGEFDASFAIHKNISDRPSKPSSIHPTLVAKCADVNKSDECKTRMAKPTTTTSVDISTQFTNGVYDSKTNDKNKPCNDKPNDEDESISENKCNDKNVCEIKPNDKNKANDENKSNEKNRDNDELDTMDEDSDHCEPENWDLNNMDDNDDHTPDELEADDEDRDHGELENDDVNNKDDTDDHTSRSPGANAKKRGWHDGDDNDEEDNATSKRVKTEIVWKDRPVTDFRLEMEGGSFLTSAEFVQLITNGVSLSSNLSSTCADFGHWA
ncbi:hypothetical protein BGZ82_002561 [Podila clonocystis]|nr:hypothetical protein BGZ82_002561 [Podila clonocystis]